MPPSTAATVAAGAEPAGDRRLRVAVAGVTGRMGRELVLAVLAAPDLRLVGALARPGDALVGRPVGTACGAVTGGGADIADTAEIVVTADFHAGLAEAQVLIDFTRPDGTMAHLRACRVLGVHAVVGTTGFSDAQQAEIVAHSQHIAVVQSPNMSVGVQVVLQLLDRAARLLGDGFDVEIVESHHRHKVDAPSGTALQMGRVVAEALGRDPATAAVVGRHGAGARAPGSIGYASLRGGDVVGDHTVVFAGPGERVEITHKSGSRSTYADGSLRAARFLATQRHGLFGMADVLAAAPAQGNSA